MEAESRSGFARIAMKRRAVPPGRGSASRLSAGVVLALAVVAAVPAGALAAVHEVPSLGEWGLLLLSLLLLTGGWFAVRRTHQTPPGQNRDSG